MPLHWQVLYLFIANHVICVLLHIRVAPRLLSFSIAILTGDLDSEQPVDTQMQRRGVKMSIFKL